MGKRDIEFNVKKTPPMWRRKKPMGKQIYYMVCCTGYKEAYLYRQRR
jgi:hypothetical protein